MDNEDDDTDIDSHSGSGSSIRHNGGSSSRSSSRSGSKSNGKSRKGGSGGAGSGGGGKADPRRGMDLAPSGTEMRAFGNLFEDVAVNPPQVKTALVWLTNSGTLTFFLEVFCR